MSTEPLDPAVIMAEHQGHGQGCHWRKLAVDEDEPCLPYRLAAELAESNRLAEVRLQRLLQLIGQTQQIRALIALGGISWRGPALADAIASILDASSSAAAVEM